MGHLANLRKILSKPDNVEQTRAVLAEHFGAFISEPVNESGELKYRAHGKVVTCPSFCTSFNERVYITTHERTSRAEFPITFGATEALKTRGLDPH
jgi:hypothetical protein